MKPTMNIGLGFLVALSTFLPAALAGAQTSSQTQPQSSLGDYARKVQKDPSAAKAKPKIYDNDNLPKDDKLSVVGQPAAVAEAEPTDAKEKSAAPADGKSTGGAKPAAAAKPADDDK